MLPWNELIFLTEIRLVNTFFPFMGKMVAQGVFSVCFQYRLSLNHGIFLAGLSLPA